MTQEAYVKGQAPGSYTEFGSVEATSNDGSLLVVSEVGKVLTFTRSGTTWSYEGSTTVTNGPFSNTTGNALSLAGDGTRLAIGSMGKAAYVYVRSGSSWTQEAVLTSPNMKDIGFFGGAIALSNDGLTLAVGAYDEDSTNVGGTNQTFTGAVHIFVRSGTSWSYQGRVLGANTEPYDYFGWSVALSADGSTLAAGAYGESNDKPGVNPTNSNSSLHAPGAAYVFTRSGTTWSQQAYIKASNPGNDGMFGWSVSLSNTGNTLAVGSYGESHSGTSPLAGAAYVFVRSASTWSQHALLHAFNYGNGDMFGFSVSLAGDGTLAVGAPGEGSNADPFDNPRPNSGAVYILERDAQGWQPTKFVKASNVDAGDHFGNVVLSGDHSTLVVGAPIEQSNATGVGGNQLDNSITGAGAAYVFR